MRMTPSGLEFRVAQLDDYQQVLNFIRDNFIHEEPINCAYPEKNFEKDEEFFMSLLPDGNIVLAFDKTDGSLAGLAGFSGIDSNYPKESLEWAEETTNKVWEDILRFMNHIETKADICNRFNVEKAMHIHGISVEKKQRGKGLGTILFQKCFETAKEKGFKLVSTDCTSVYSSKIAERVGMELVSSVTYDEYHKKIGKVIFNPVPPNLEIRTYVKHLA